MRPAAGITCIAESTGRIFLMLRSDGVSEPGTWAVPAGRIDEGEVPEEAAVRELWEEAGYDGPIELTDSDSYHSLDRWFFSFIVIVPVQFEHRLNWENDDAGWFDLNDLPHPLHYGMRPVLRELGVVV